MDNNEAMSAINRNPRRRAAYVEAATTALASLPRKGDQNVEFEVDMRGLIPGFPGSGYGYTTDGYHNLLQRLVAEVVHLKPGQSLTIRIPTEEERRSMRLQALEYEGWDAVLAADEEARCARRREAVA